MLTLKKEGRLLRMQLTEEGREFLLEEYGDDAEHGRAYDDAGVLLRLLEPHLCNGWTSPKSEEVGALTDSLLLSDDFEYSEQEDRSAYGNLYWDPDYAVTDYVKELLINGEVVFVEGRAS